MFGARAKLKKSSREAAKEGLRGAKSLVATNVQVPRDECSRWSRPMMRFVATNRMFRRDQFNVSSRPIKTNVATNQLTPRRGLFVVSSGMKTSKIAALKSSAATGRMEKDGYKKKAGGIRAPSGAKNHLRGRRPTRMADAAGFFWVQKKAGGVLLSHGRVPHYPRRWGA